MDTRRRLIALRVLSGFFLLGQIAWSYTPSLPAAGAFVPLVAGLSCLWMTQPNADEPIGDGQRYLAMSLIFAYVMGLVMATMDPHAAWIEHAMRIGLGSSFWLFMVLSPLPD